MEQPTSRKLVCWLAREPEAGGRGAHRFPRCQGPWKWAAPFWGWSFTSCSSLCIHRPHFWVSLRLQGIEGFVGWVGLVDYRVWSVEWGCWNSLSAGRLPADSYLLFFTIRTTCLLSFPIVKLLISCFNWQVSLGESLLQLYVYSLVHEQHALLESHVELCEGSEK